MEIDPERDVYCLTKQKGEALAFSKDAWTTSVGSERSRGSRNSRFFDKLTQMATLLGPGFHMFSIVS